MTDLNRYVPKNSFNNTSRLLSEFYATLASIRNNESVNIIDAKSLYYPQTLIDNSYKIPEFSIDAQAGNFFKVTRNSYSMSNTNDQKLTCCLIDTPYYIIDNILLTCDPMSKDLVYSNFCDNVMLNYCLNNLTVSKCSTWLYNALDRMENTINLFMQPYCVNNLFTPICKVYIDGLRKNNNNILSDLLLNNVWNNTKDSRLNCSFNKYYSDKVNAPKVCWSYECMNTPDYLLSSTDLLSKSLCQLYSCNIVLTNVVINNKSNIKINCLNQINDNNSLLKIALADKRNVISNFIPYLIIPFMLLLT